MLRQPFIEPSEHRRTTLHPQNVAHLEPAFACDACGGTFFGEEIKSIFLAALISLAMICKQVEIKMALRVGVGIVLPLVGQSPCHRTAQTNVQGGQSLLAVENGSEIGVVKDWKLR